MMHAYTLLLLILSLSLSAMENNGKNPVRDEEETYQSPLLSSIPNLPPVIHDTLLIRKEWALERALSILAQFSGARLKHRINLDAIAFSPDGKLFATSDQLHTTRIFDTATYACLHTIDRHGRQLTWSPDGKHLALASGNSILIIDPQSGKHIRRFNHSCYIRALAWNTDSIHVAMIDKDSAVQIINVKSGEIVYKTDYVLSTGFHFAGESYCKEIIWSPDGQLLATSCRNGYTDKHEVCVINRLTKNETHLIGARSISFAPRSSDGKQRAVICDGTLTKIIDVQGLRTSDTPEQIVDRKRNNHSCYAQFDRSGKKLAISDSQYVAIHEWIDNKQSYEFKNDCYAGHHESISWDHYGRYITANQCCSVRLIDTEKKDRLSITSYGHTDNVIWSSGTQFAKRDYGTAKIFDLAELEDLKKIVHEKITCDHAELLDALKQTYEDQRGRSDLHPLRIHPNTKQYQSWLSLKRILPIRISNRLARFIVDKNTHCDGYDAADEDGYETPQE